MRAHFNLMKFTMLLLAVLGPIITTQPRLAQALTTSWQLPLGGDGYTYATKTGEKYGSTVVNTNFNVRNLELISPGADDELAASARR